MSKITKEQFREFEEVRESGETNMYDIEMVSHLSGLTKEEIREIMENYDNLQKEFGKN